jgi:hypothetical protein
MGGLWSRLTWAKSKALSQKSPEQKGLEVQKSTCCVKLSSNSVLPRKKKRFSMNKGKEKKIVERA